MTAPAALCGLCLKPSKLQDSHLLPAALYKLSRDPTSGTDPNPVMVMWRKVYDVEPLLGSNVDQYLYFAASVFWRASAHRWKMGNDPVGQISLGDRYQEQFRLYLLGKAAFPPNARIIVHVSTEAQPDLLTTVYPCTTRVDGVRRHKFYIPGVLFILFLGRDVQTHFDAGALNGSQRQLMWLCPWQNDSLFVASMDLVKASTPSGKLRR